MLNDPNYAVEFGHTVDMGLLDQKIYPCILSLYDRNSDEWELDKGTNPMAWVGPLVAAGGVVDHSLKMAPDCPFQLLFIKYSVYYVDQGGEKQWYETPANPPELHPFYEKQYTAGTPLLRSLRVSLTARGPDGRYLYGGTNLDAVVNLGGDLLPVSPAVLEGTEWGPAQMHTPFMLPPEGELCFRFTNTHATKALYVAAMVYGQKVAL